MTLMLTQKTMNNLHIYDNSILLLPLLIYFPSQFEIHHAIKNTFIIKRDEAWLTSCIELKRFYFGREGEEHCTASAELCLSCSKRKMVMNTSKASFGLVLVLILVGYEVAGDGSYYLFMLLHLYLIIETGLLWIFSLLQYTFFELVIPS